MYLRGSTTQSRGKVPPLDSLYPPNVSYRLDCLLSRFHSLFYPSFPVTLADDTSQKPFASPIAVSSPACDHKREMGEARLEDGVKKDVIVTVIYNAHADVSDVDEAKLVRKIDWRLLPWLSFLYLLSFLDRTSIGNAKVHRPIPLLRTALTFRQLYHLTDDLRLSDKEYLLCLTIFYISYSLFEVRLPSRASSSSSQRILIGPK